MKLDAVLRKYDYHLPPELIAQAPAKPRDAARLLVYNRTSSFPSPKDGEGQGRGLRIRFDIFANLSKYLPKNAVLVFNQTKVWPARLIVTKPTGGKAELLYISHDKNFIKVLSNKTLKIADSPKINGRENWDYNFKVVKKQNQFYFLKPRFPMSRLPKILKKYGVTPLPPYIKHSPLTEKQKREQYQTIFAKNGLSVAAPTASLHFTKRLVNSLQKQGIDLKFIRLDVGLGTFAPLRDDNLKIGKLHQEYYQIDKSTAQFLNRAKAQGRPIIAVGTTVARTLESACLPSPLPARQSLGDGGARGDAPKGQRGRNADTYLTKLTGQTDLFIRENYQFKFVDGLITNFHVPKSSLLMLVSAFAGRKNIVDIYRQAIKKRFRFFSFGDGMLIL